MANVQYYDVILKPVVTEKSMNAMAEKKYTFLVHPDANKTMIKEAVERMFEGTKVAKVNTMNCEGTLYIRSISTGSATSLMPSKFVPLTTRPFRTSRQGMMRFVIMVLLLTSAPARRSAQGPAHRCTGSCRGWRRQSPSLPVPAALFPRKYRRWP